MEEYLDMLSDELIGEIRAELARTVGEDHFHRFMAFCANSDKFEGRVELPGAPAVLVKMRGPLSVLSEGHLRASLRAYVADVLLPEIGKQ